MMRMMRMFMGPAPPFPPAKTMIRLLIAGLWFVLFAVSVVAHWANLPDTAVTRTLRPWWAFVVLMLIIPLLSSRADYAVKLVFCLANAHMGVCYISLVFADGLNWGQIAFLTFAIVVMVLAVLQFRRDGVLFPSTDSDEGEPRKPSAGMEGDPGE